MKRPKPEDHIRLVEIAVRTLRRKNYFKLFEEEDMMSDGFVGLTIACRDYDSSRGKFESYAHKVILFQTLRRTMGSNLIRIPYYIQVKDPSKLKTDNQRKIFREIQHLKKQMIRENREGISMVSYIPYIDNSAECDEIREEIKARVDTLPEIERDVVRKFYGIDCEKMTRRAIGTIYGMSSTWVSGTINTAISRLRDKIRI